MQFNPDQLHHIVADIFSATDKPQDMLTVVQTILDRQGYFIHTQTGVYADILGTCFMFKAENEFGDAVVYGYTIND